MKNPRPDWLPDLLELMPWKTDTFKVLYDLFKIDFIESAPVYMGKKIIVPKQKENDGEEIFNHLTSKKDEDTGERLPDIKRAERLLWIKPIIEHADEPEIFDWDYYDEDKKRIITYLWLKDYDFIVIMKKLKNERRVLLTAYYVKYNNAKRKFEKKYADRING